MAKQGQLTNWAFIVGALLAIIMGLGAAAGAGFANNAWLILLLVVLGLVVGFANITKKEVGGFLLAVVALVLVGSAGIATINTLIPFVGSFLAETINRFIVFVAPAALVVAVRSAWNLAEAK
ncbi:hypothetical protein ACFLZ7_00525 [Nanoarchaeota archaeon]